MQKLSEKQRLENENAALKALLSEKLLEIEQYKQQIKGNRSMIKFSVRYEQWLEEIKGQIQENTRENYISIYKNHLGPYFGDRMLDEIAPQEIERYYTTRSAMHLNIHTIHRHHANLHSFFKYAHRCCFSKRMRKLFRKNEKSVLRFCNKSSKTKRAFTKVLMPCKRPF